MIKSNSNNVIYLIGLMGLNETLYTKYLTQCLTHSKYLININCYFQLQFFLKICIGVCLKTCINHTCVVCVLALNSSIVVYTKRLLILNINVHYRLKHENLTSSSNLFNLVDQEMLFYENDIFTLWVNIYRHLESH